MGRERQEIYTTFCLENLKEESTLKTVFGFYERKRIS
jgi:hypothetical protein